MDQSLLLTQARSEFMRSFEGAVKNAIPLCIDDMLVGIDASLTSKERIVFLDAKNILTAQETDFLQRVTKAMDYLLVRSFQTTYDSYRPTVSYDINRLSLIDAQAFEGSLQQEEIINHYRRVAENPLRDLNIRIALMFEQEATNERENPFRPYLFVKCFSNVFEQGNYDKEVGIVLLKALTKHFVKEVPDIYNKVNELLAKHGVAAQLQLKIKKSPDSSYLASSVLQNSSIPMMNSQPLTSQIMEEQHEVVANFPNVDNMATHLSHQTLNRVPPQVAQAVAQMQAQASPFQQLFRGAINRAKGLFGASGDALPHDDSGVLGDFSHTSQSLGGSTGYPHSELSSTLGGKNVNFDGTFPASGISPGKASSSWMDNSQGLGTTLKRMLGFTSTMSQQIGIEGQSIDTQTLLRPQYQISPELPSAVAHIQRNHTPLTGAEMFDARGGVRNLIFEQREALYDLVKTDDEQMVIDVVAMLFEFILRDTQVPAEIRAQLGRLQLLVLKIALKDQSFLTDKGHPVRLLVNRIGSIAINLKEIDPSGEGMTKEICRIVEILLEDDSENPDLFAQMLDEFDAYIAKELRESSNQTKEVVGQVEELRNRTLRYAHTAGRLKAALIELKIDPYLQNFLETIWVHVLAKADKEDSEQAREYRLLVPSLLWSITPKYGQDEKSQFLSMLPKMLSTFRRGLQYIGFDPNEKEKLLDWFVDAHAKAMRISSLNATEPRADKYPSLDRVHEYFARFFEEPDVENYQALDEAKEIGVHENVNQFMEQQVQELKDKAQILDEVYAEQQPIESELEETPAMEESANEVMKQLKAGVEVEISLGGAPNIGTLSWVDPALTNLVLTLEGQEQPSIVSSRMFRRMIAHGRVKFLEVEPLFERAVQSLLKSVEASV